MVFAGVNAAVLSIKPGVMVPVEGSAWGCKDNHLEEDEDEEEAVKEVGKMEGKEVGEMVVKGEMEEVKGKMEGKGSWLRVRLLELKRQASRGP